LTALLIVGLMAGLAWAQETFFTYLPVVLLQPTPTPTHTPIPTITPTPTATALAGSPESLTGELALCNPNQTTYSLFAAICVNETLRNPTNSVIYYGILGVEVVRLSDNFKWFQTSWSGNPLAIDPFCTGPTDRCSGVWEDNIRGSDDTAGFKEAGQYRLTLALCYPTKDACLLGQGTWRTLTPGLNISVQ
jgi:hypothetical protein